MALTIVGKPSDVERYKKERGVIRGVDPITGQKVKYGGLKRFGPKAAERLGENNPWLKYGPDFRMGVAHIRVKAQGEKGYGEDDRVEIMGIANANIVDRYDERLDPAGVITDDFNKNPVLLVDHMYTTRAVVGRVTNITPEHDGVKFEGFVGDPKAVGGIQNLTDSQRETRSLVAQGLVQTVSVGFIPKKIRAPAYDEEGALVEPAVIEQWQLLELSVVAIPANPGSTFEMRQYALSLNGTDAATYKSGNTALTLPPLLGKNVKEIISDLKADNATEVQTLIFDKEHFTAEEAQDWAKAHGFKSEKVDETDDSYRLRQRDPSDFEEDTLRTIELTEGVDAVVGRVKEEQDAMTEEQFKQMMEGLNGIKQSINDGMKSLSDQNEKILAAQAEAKGTDKPKDDEEEDESKKMWDAINELRESQKQTDAVIGKIYETVTGEKVA